MQQQNVVVRLPDTTIYGVARLAESLDVPKSKVWKALIRRGILSLADKPMTKQECSWKPQSPLAREEIKP